MTVTTGEGKKTMDPPIPSGIEDYRRKDDEAEEVTGELVDKSEKEAETPLKVTHIPRPPPLFPQR